MKNKKSPSRIKYEESHPTISARVSLETKNRLQRAMAVSGLSTADLFKSIADELELKTIPIQEARKESYKKGYSEAREKYIVTFPCSVCGKTMVVNAPEIKQIIRNYLMDQGWGHTECIKQSENKFQRT
jgi:deoxycytidylate deaminase